MKQCQRFAILIAKICGNTVQILLDLPAWKKIQMSAAGFAKMIFCDLPVYQYLQCELVRLTLFKGHLKDGLICRYLPLHGCIAPLEFIQLSSLLYSSFRSSNCPVDSILDRYEKALFCFQHSSKTFASA